MQEDTVNPMGTTSVSWEMRVILKKMNKLFPNIFVTTEWVYFRTFCGLDVELFLNERNKEEFGWRKNDESFRALNKSFEQSQT